MPNHRVLDFVGIGFGPAGVSLASAFEDVAEKVNTNFTEQALFLEREVASRWQAGLLFRNVDIQHHYLRDLATPRNPRSKFTFPNFLKEKNRLFEFGSLVYGGGGGAVSRIEWSEYLEWAASELKDYVQFNQEVIELGIHENNGEKLIEVTTTSSKFLARSIAYCAGQSFNIPELFQPYMGPSVFHGTRFLEHMRSYSANEEISVAIIGAGQSSIEIALHLHNQYPNAKINCIHRKVGFQHGNHSPFVQRMFHPQESDYFFKLDKNSRMEILDEVHRANYASVDKEAVSAFYRNLYEDKLLGIERVTMYPSSTLTGFMPATEGKKHRIEILNSHDRSQHQVEADVIVLCTGFTRTEIPELLSPLVSQYEYDTERFLNYDFSLNASDPSMPLIYIPGAAEPTHGLGSSNSFSMVAIKSGRVCDALLQKKYLVNGQEGFNALERLDLSAAD